RDSVDRERVIALDELPELCLEGLDEVYARTLLTSALTVPLDERVLERIVAESRGNPLALIELPLSAHSTHLAGEFALPESDDVPLRVEESFRRRVRNLPVETRLLLLLAASDPTGDVALLWRAAEHLGADAHAVGHAESAGLVEIDTQV